ncbi:MAG: methylmalonyl-CoA mutase small subunit [Bacteroidaceae bacterium]|nr:methylmalonyl-CoA mutase small subunit [Bacteroidaceae bacterium]MBQ5840269.1 methylmalonyl-CoA mutase small subunit [Bacteroidaceae bacterium]MBQ5913053.1 methylmalonyl-CoA mutase small subunit [Bacteroidaceae bacterium]
MADSKEKLFSDFVAPSAQEWREKIEVDLKGADYQKKMVWKTNEGFSMEPFYRKEDVENLATVNALPGDFPYVRGNKAADNSWYVRQDIKCGDCAKEANAKALDVLNRGVDSLGFIVPGEKVNKEYVEALLEGILAECVELNFRTCQCHCVELAQILVEYFEAKGYDKARLAGSISFDPLEKMVMKGKDTEGKLAVAKTLVETLAAYPLFRAVAVNAYRLTDAGAYSYQDLGYALAWGNEYMAQLTEAGVPAELAAENIKFNLGINGVYFMEIAKLRAARMLWAHVVGQYTDNKEAAKMHVCAYTTTYNQTVFDSYVNMLRSQTEAMSAALGGVESLVVVPFDAPYETPTDFAERIARNQQLLLKDECHFDRMVDVAGGSYFIEQLTKSLSEQAWNLFLSVEEQGGFLAAVKAGAVQAVINDTNAKRHADAGKRKEFLLGTNQFPNFTEKSEGKAPVDCCCKCSCGEQPAIAAINASRLSSEFEALRLTTEKAEKVPVAFMLTIGNLAMRQARAQFSCNFLAAAGYQVVDNLGFQTVEEGVDAALAAGADIVVICSSDDEYAEYAVPAYEYLNGRAMFVVAGAPACTEDLQKAGIENFIHVRVDQLKTLKEYNAKLGI